MIHKIPNRLSGTQLMILTNAILSALHCKTATLIDKSRIVYVGCNGKEEQIYLIELFTYQGKEHSWYQQFGYVNRNNEQEIATMMRNIHNRILHGIVKFGKMTMEFKKEQKLGDMMMDYWQKDKCTFSKIHNSPSIQGVFHQLRVINGLSEPKTKTFET